MREGGTAMNGPSYVSGASAGALLGQTIGAAFDAASEAHAGREALVVRHQGVRLSYAELRRQVDAVACSFLRMGLRPGDRVGVWSPNSLEWALTQFATAKAGLIQVNLNPAYRRIELAFALRKAGCRALVLAPSFKTSRYELILRALAPELEHCAPGALRAAELSELEMVVLTGSGGAPGMYGFEQLLQAPSAQELDGLARLGGELQFDQPINIQFTSGTTGAPKGVTLSHHNILNNGYFVAERIRLAPGDRLCIPVPLYHCFGMVMGNLAALTHGATMVYPAEGFDAAATMQAVAEERCTALYGVPTMFIAMLDHPEFGRHDFSSLRTGIMAGSPCPIDVMQRVIERMHMPSVTIAYGMTETSPVSFQSDVDDSVERRVATVGRVHPHCEVKIVDPQGRIVPRGEAGELCTRGYSVMLGYWNEPEKTAEAVDAAGWMHSGDLATLDADGYCRICGRIKDMVIRGGENLYPREIEEFLYRHPKVEDVQVVGVPDARYGEELCACIVLRRGEAAQEEEIRAFCRGEIAHHKVPRYVRFVESFPTTITGKVQKFELRRLAIDALGLAGEADAPSAAPPAPP